MLEAAISVFALQARHVRARFECPGTSPSHIHREKMEQILLAYGLPKETVNIIMMYNKNAKDLVGLLDGDTDFFDIVTGVLQGDALVPFQFIIYPDYVQRMSI